MPKKITSVDDLTPDPENANLGTARGAALLDESVETCGFGRSIVVDKHGVVIGGNKTLKAAVKAGVDVEVVQTRGHELVVVQRTDLDLIEDTKARQLAYYDNRVQEVDLLWSPQQVNKDFLGGVDVGQAFLPDEISSIVSRAVDLPNEPDEPLPVVAESNATALLSNPVPELLEPVKAKPFNTTALVFADTPSRFRFRAFQWRLRERYPDLTPSGRLSAYLVSRGFPVPGDA